MPETTTTTPKQPKVRKPSYIAAKLHEELATFDARVARARSALADAEQARDLKLAELGKQTEEVKKLVAAMRGGEATEPAAETEDES